MKKIHLIILILFLSILVISSCALIVGGSKIVYGKKEVISEKNFLVKNMKYERNVSILGDHSKLFIDTEEETLVAKVSNVVFTKTNEPTNVDVLKIEAPRGNRTYTVLVVNINKEEVRERSKEYSSILNETMEFTE